MGEFNTNVTSYVESRDQSGPAYKTFAQYSEGHCRGKSNYGDAQQLESARRAGKKVTRANSSRPDTPVMDALQYEELLQRIKRQENEITQQENEIAQLRQACMGSQQKLNRPTVTSNYPHCDNNKLPTVSVSALSLEITNIREDVQCSKYPDD